MRLAFKIHRQVIDEISFLGFSAQENITTILNALA